MVYDYFKTEDHMSQVYGLNDLTDLTWYGDGRMLDFLQQWDFILDHLEGDTLITLHANGEKTLRDLLFRQVEKSTALAEDVAHYKRVGKSHADHSYRFLRDMIERSVENSHQRKIVEERRNAIRAGNHAAIENAPASPATTATGGGGSGAAPKATAPALPASAGSGTQPKPKKRPKSRPPPRSSEAGGSEGAKPPKPAKVDLKEVPCYFHSAEKYGAGNGCSKGAKCPFSHGKFMSKTEFEAAKRPSRSASASRRKGDGKGKASPPRPPTPGAGRRKVPFHCNKFLKEGSCQYGDNCKFPHLTKAQYDEELAKMKAAAAADTA